MAINAYVGLQGSGKSYEVVSGPIVEAVAAGRRVVTNVAGINPEKIFEYLQEKRGLSRDVLGSVVQIENAEVAKPDFFPDEEKPDVPSFVLPGDMVVIDEAWRPWGVDSGKLTHNHMQFFRMHRHYVHPETKVSCDVCLMTQDIMGLHRSLRAVVEATFKMTKLKSVGLHSRYRVDVFEGYKISDRTRTASYQKGYDSDIFPLYSSYTGGAGTEKVIDKRQNLFNKGSVWALIVALPLLFGVGLFLAMRFFHPKQPKPTNARVAQQSAPAVASAVGSPSAQGGAAPSGSVSEWSDTWRVVGEFSGRGLRWVVVANQAGRLRVESPSQFVGAGVAAVGSIDGRKVSIWSASAGGVAPAPGPSMGVK